MWSLNFWNSAETFARLLINYGLTPARAAQPATARARKTGDSKFRLVVRGMRFFGNAIDYQGPTPPSDNSPTSLYLSFSCVPICSVACMNKPV